MTTTTTNAIEAKIRELGPWFHNMDLGGVRTAPEHFLGDYPNIKWKRFAHAIPADLRGKSVLDIGCNAGFYSMEMKRRGASRVVGIDSDERYLAQARFATEVNELDIEYRRMDVYDVEKLGEKFDVVIFMGVLYHLRHPLLALDLLHDHVVKETLIFQTMMRGSLQTRETADDYPFSNTQVFEEPGFPAMYFVEKNYAGDPTNWWVPNLSCAQAMLRSAGFEIVAHPEVEVMVCRRAEARR